MPQALPRRFHGETVLAREHRLALGLFLSLLLAALVATVIAVRASALPDEAFGVAVAMWRGHLADAPSHSKTAGY